MSAVIEITNPSVQGLEATVNNGVWSCSDSDIADMLNELEVDLDADDMRHDDGWRAHRMVSELGALATVVKAPNWKPPEGASEDGLPVVH